MHALPHACAAIILLTGTRMTMPEMPTRLSLGKGVHFQRLLLDHLRDRSQAVDDRARKAAGGLGEEQLARPRADGGWGVGQILEHLVIAADEYLGELDRRLGTGTSRGAPEERWRPSFLGGVLIRSLDEKAMRRMPAPRRWRVDRQRAAPDALARFLATQERLRASIERARAHDLRRVRFASPVLPLLRMNAGDALSVIVVHSERHIAQLERAAGALRGGAVARS